MLVSRFHVLFGVKADCAQRAMTRTTSEEEHMREFSGSSHREFLGSHGLP
jgi:hypothetical protein